MSNDSNRPCGVLYVDDEEKALKYFRMAFAPKYEVFTASSGAEGLEVLERERGRIGIVVSDQRMPGMLGAEFLGQVRRSAPNVVRILTTAYSDLESAIQAVNQGHIYQYVVKPWEIPDLGMILQRAADYHSVLSERDALLALKLSTVQRVVCSDRLRWLLQAGEAMDVPEAFRRALVACIRVLPDDLSSTSATFDARRFSITDLLLREYRNSEACLSWLRESPGSVTECLERCVAASGISGCEVLPAESGGALVRISGEGNGPEVLQELFSLFLKREASEASIRLLQAVAKLGNGAIVLEIGDAAPIRIVLPSEAPSSEEVIRELYERFEASDIARI